MAISIMHCINGSFLLQLFLNGKENSSAMILAYHSKFSFINRCEWEVKIELFSGNKVAALTMKEIVDCS